MQSHILGTLHPLASEIMLTHGDRFLSDFAGVERVYFPRALHTVIYRVLLSSWVTVRGKSPPRMMQGCGVWQREIHLSDPPSRKNSLPSYSQSSWGTASLPSNFWAKVVLCSESPSQELSDAMQWRHGRFHLMGIRLQQATLLWVTSWINRHCIGQVTSSWLFLLPHISFHSWYSPPKCMHS